MQIILNLIFIELTKFEFVNVSVKVQTIGIKCQDNEDFKLPKDFAIGAATAAYQIEGAWNISGKPLEIFSIKYIP